MRQAVIFDLDGTLADTLEDIARAVNATLTQRHLPAHPMESFRQMVGNGLRVLIGRALPEELRNDALIEEVRKEASASYEAHALVSTRPYPGIPEVLHELQQRGVMTAVLSNKPQALCDLVVAGLFPRATFAVVRGESAEFPCKPDPTSALDIATRLGLEPTSIAYLGDSDVDMKTARAAHMLALGAGWGFRGEAELRAAGAAAVLSFPSELLDHL